MAITKIPAAGFTGNNFRNIIINGDMSIAQRSTSVASITASGYYTIDRMATTNFSAGTWTQSQSTDVPTGQGFASSLKMDCTTANASLSASSQLGINQTVEAQNCQYFKYGTANAQSLTISFWVKSNKTGTYIVWFTQADDSRQNAKSYTINTANTWEKKTLTISGDTTGVIDNNNGEGLQIRFILASGTDYTSGTSPNGTWEAITNANRYAGQTVNLADDTANEWYITGVQLEAGTTASDFEFLPYDVNLDRCQRYYQIVSTITGNATTSEIADMQVQPINNLRASPTVSQNGVLNVYDDIAGAFTQSTTGIGSLGTFNTRGGIVRISNFSGMTTNRFLLTSGSSNGVTLSSEL
jgi:hypothetical protein